MPRLTKKQQRILDEMRVERGYCDRDSPVFTKGPHTTCGTCGGMYPSGDWSFKKGKDKEGRFTLWGCPSCGAMIRIRPWGPGDVGENRIESVSDLFAISHER